MLEVRTAEEAMFLSHSYEHPIHVLITGIVLSQKRGTDLPKELGNKRPALKILFMSGHVEQIERDDVSLTRKIPVLQKPFTKEVFLAKVREVLDL